MHVYPVQLLGLPAKVGPEFLPNKTSLHRAWKDFRVTWHPDRWRKNGFKNTHEAHVAFYRAQEANDILLKRYQNPLYPWSRVWLDIGAPQCQRFFGQFCLRLYLYTAAIAAWSNAPGNCTCPLSDNWIQTAKRDLSLWLQDCYAKLEEFQEHKPTLVAWTYS